MDEPRLMMRPRQPLDPGSVRGDTDQEVLQGFVATVRAWRGPSTTAPRFRRDDLAVLVGILGTDADTIEQRLSALTGCDRATATRFRRLLLVGLAAIPMVPVVLAMSASADGAVSTRSAEASIPPVIASTAVPDARAAPAAVAAPPAAAPTPPEAAAPQVTQLVAPAVPAPAPAQDPSPALQGTEVTLAVPALGIDLPVVDGGQDVIDQGLVAHYWAPGWLDPVAPGAIGTYWLAAHRETHGAPFLRLPEVQVGERIVVTTATGTFTYAVTFTEVVRDDAGFGPVYGLDPAAPVILLQTCLDHVRRLLVHGVLIPAG